MILVCPLCQKNYLVQASAFAHGPRYVRCASCKHGWQAQRPDQPYVVSSAFSEKLSLPQDPSLASDNSANSEQGNMPASIPSPLMQIWLKVRWPFFFIIFAWTLSWLIIDRQHIGHRWPFLIPAYNAVDLYIYFPGDELEFNQVKSELKFENGITRLNLEGKIWNRTKYMQKVPAIIAQALGSDGSVIQSWQIDAPKATLAPNEEVPFASSINAPKGNVANMNLNFVESQDDE